MYLRINNFVKAKMIIIATAVATNFGDISVHVVQTE